MQTKEDIFLEGQILDKILQCQENYVAVHTGFLDLHQQSLAQNIIKREIKKRGIKALFYGAYEEAIRRILFFFPDYVEKDSCGEFENSFGVLEVSKIDKKISLTHRDYLGAFTGLGLKREMLGDILVREEGADLIALKEIIPILLKEYHSVGKSSVRVREKPLQELIFSENVMIRERGSVSSLRLDNVLSEIFHLSRAQAQEWIQKGNVYVNYVEKRKNESPVQDGDMIVIRGKGKRKIDKIEAVNKKNKFPIYYIKY